MTVFICSKVFRNKNGHVKPVYSSNKCADSNERAHTYGGPLFCMLRVNMRNDCFRESMVLTVPGRVHNWLEHTWFAIIHK